uniref:Uncharacterized protein n=1 Tax=Rhizophora mucronata TaxID=61149 RepID=A0A2P2NQR2_RHIMU
MLSLRPQPISLLRRIFFHCAFLRILGVYYIYFSVLIQTLGSLESH